MPLERAVPRRSVPADVRVSWQFRHGVRRGGRAHSADSPSIQEQFVSRVSRHLAELVAATMLAALNMASFDAGITNAQASGYVLNTTVTEPSAAGYLTVHAGDVATPLASNLNFVAG